MIFMGQMVRSKREWKCSNCGYKYIKWAGTCYRGCGFTGTLEENNISNRPSNQRNERLSTNTTEKSIGVPKPSRDSGTAEAKRLRRRAKESERDIAKRMVSADGADPAYRNIASSTGRIGFITGMRVDAISRSYVTENKNRKMPTWLIQAWVLINQRAVDFNKNALLHVDPPNMPRDFVIHGGKQKLDTMAILTQTRHEELINHERILEALINYASKRKNYYPLVVLYEELLRDFDAALSAMNDDKAN